MTSPVIRPATPDDLPGIRAVLAAAYAPAMARLPDLPDVTAVSAGDLQALDVAVAIRDGAVAGVVMLSVEGPVAHLANVAVDPAAGGLGIGGRLIDHAIAGAARAGCERIDLATHADMAGNLVLYERRGWRETGRSATKVTMSRPLTGPPFS